MDYWYKYRDDLWKLVRMNDRGEASFNPRKATTDEKLKGNIRRAARTIQDYALCNEWDWFGNFTLSPVYRDRADLDGFRQDFMQFIRNCRRKYGDIEAILVPELHKNKDGWHMHGLLRGIPVEAFRLFGLKEHIPKPIMDKRRAGDLVYDWPEYRLAFGWVDMEPIKNRDAAARYISKYITKSGDSTAQAIDLGKHLYYVTRGLSKPERIETENASGGEIPEAFPAGLVAGRRYEFDYGEVQWFERPRVGSPDGAGAHKDCTAVSGAKSRENAS